MPADSNRQNPVIPDKAFFRIGEVAEIVGVKPYVIRYWETEFKQLRPTKTRTNQRVYTRRDVQLLLTIKTLLYEDHFTIEGARQQLSQTSTRDSVSPGGPADVGTDNDEQVPDLVESTLPQLHATQMKSFLNDLEETKRELERLQRKLEQTVARANELERKLAEERKLRSHLISYLQNECREAIKLLDSHLDGDKTPRKGPSGRSAAW